MNEFDLVDPVAVAGDRVAGAPPWEMGDELRWTAANLAYRAAKDYEQALRRIERHLVIATNKNGTFSHEVDDVALDVIRTHMVRGLLHAQAEAGDHMAFWVSR